MAQIPRRMNSAITFNRTYEELKSLNKALPLTSAISFNRTYEELKFKKGETI